MGEEGTTTVPLNSGEAGALSDLSCVSNVVVDWAVKVGDRGGDLGERGESVVCVLIPPLTGD